MEVYKTADIKDNLKVIVGNYANKVSEKHRKSYGENGANNIRNNVVETFGKLLSQIDNPNETNNSLLVGKVQSGKTSNLELLTALAFDNGYKVLVIYGGYDDSLLKQTTDRFRATFDSPSEPDYSNEVPAIFSTSEKNPLDLTEEIFKELLDCKPVIFVSMKRPAAMKKINMLFSQFDMVKIKSFIIDDEGDQASLNTAKDKKNDGSATYKQIVEMKRNLKNPLYLSVTATPQANIYLDNFSAVKPASIHLIRPGIGYTGGDIYHLNDDNHIIEVIDEMDEETMTFLPESLKEAIRYFIIGSAVKNKLKANNAKSYSDMIIHSVREVSQHKEIYSCVSSFLDNYKNAFRNNNSDIELYFDELKKVYDVYLDENYRIKFSFESLKEEIKNVVAKIYIILKNSAGKNTQGNEKLKLHRIWIGGDLLQRGLTFSDLITTYFTRWPKNGGGNMDTNLQRARWFGYRYKYIDLCKIFTTKEIAIEFSNLAEMENNIWEQFDEVENGALNIEDIIIEAENTKQSPTSKNKANFKKLSFRQMWKMQRNIVYNEDDVRNNNDYVTEFIKKHSWKPTFAGSKIRKVTANFIETMASEIKVLLERMEGVFVDDDESIKKNELLKILTEQKVFVVLMQADGKPISRSLYLNGTRIKALQEGRRKTFENDSSYEGDSKVIIDENYINIQIYFLEPCYKNNGEKTVLKAKTQYVFAFYMPDQKNFFVKG